MKIWFDHDLVEPEKARLPVLDHGLLYGDGLFEGFRVFGRRLFRLDDHLKRLSTGAKAIGLRWPGGINRVRDIVLKTAAACGRDEAYGRLVITRGEGALGIDTATCREPHIICIFDKINVYGETKYTNGIDLLTSSLRRPPADVLDPRVKSLNYLNNVLAKREAVSRGGDDALLLNQRGLVAEASVANVFAVLNGVLATPPAQEGALGGITRKSVLELAVQLKLPCEERPLSRFDLFDADEVFIAGTGVRLMPVAHLDGESIGEPGIHPIADAVTAAYPDFARKNGTPFDDVNMTLTAA